MKITEIMFYDGARGKISKLGLADLFLEHQEILIQTKVFLLEEKDANDGPGERLKNKSGKGKIIGKM
jgi:hypothetical protein